MKIRIVYKNPTCSFSEKIDIGHCVFNGKTTQIGLGEQGADVSGNEANVVIKGTGWSSIADKKIYIAIKATCSDVFSSTDLAIFNTACSSTTFKTTGTNPGGSTTTTIQFYPILKVDSTRTCDKITLNASSCSSTGSYKWELSDDNASWKTIGKITESITLTPAEIVSIGFSDPYSNKYVRVIDPGLSDRTLPALAFNLYAPSPSVSINGSTDVICKGDANGKVTLQISNTVSQVNQFYINGYHEDGGLMVEPTVSTGTYQITGLKAGKWSFQVVNNYVKDTYGACNTNVTYTVLEPTQVSVDFKTQFYNGYAIKCNGGSTGETTAIGSGGVGGYKDFSWSTGAITENISGIKAGTYTVTLKDANDCEAKNEVVLQEPVKLQVALSKATDYNSYPVSCWDKSDGAIKSTVSNGITTEGYTYRWSTGANTSSVSGLGVNAYSLAVTDANGCTASSSLALTAPPKIDFAINQLTTLTCPGDKTAILEAKPVAATIIGAVHYKWASGETTASVADIGAGTYSLIVSDDQGCSTNKSITLDEPVANTVSIVAQSNFNGSVIKCNGDTNGILAALVKDENNNTITAQNYSWTENETTLGESPTLSSVKDLGEGLYKVIITYRNQCKAEASYFLTDPDPVTVAVSQASNYNGQVISCYNMTDGKLHAIASGGTSTLDFTWNTGATGSLLSGVGAGSYTVDVKDVNGCTGSGSMALENPIQVQAQITDVSDYSGYGVSCFGSSDGTIASVSSGGTGIYTYMWSNGKTTAVIANLSAGDYTLVVSDNNGCKQSVAQTITTPTAIAFTIADQKNISCFDGNDGFVKLQASGGVQDYSYSKDNKATWQSENIFSLLKQGSYTIALRDGNGCEKTVASTLMQPAKINISFTDIQPAFCGNPAGTARAVVTGGVNGYTYSWQDSKANVIDVDATLSSARGGIYTLTVHDNNACPMTGSVGITSTDGAKSDYIATATKCFDSSDGSAAITITEGDGPFVIEWPDGQSNLQGMNLKKGLYDVLITDGHSCTVVQTVDIPAPNALALKVKSATIPTCNGVCDGQLTLEASGGVGNYRYEWNNKTGATQTQLCAAIYPVVLKDGNNCTLTQDIELKHPDPIEITVTKSTLATCRDGCDGSLEVAAIGGNGGYEYIWASGGNSNIKTNICPGSYTVAVADAKGCKGESTIILDNTPALPLDLGGGVTLCVGQTYTLNAGPDWSSIAWESNNGFTSQEQHVVIKDAGSYWIKAVSDKGCVAQDTFLLETSYDLLKASFMIPKEAVAGDTVVMIDISWPLPEKIEWNYPLEMTKLQDNGDVLYGEFRNAGTYEVSLATHLGECFDKVSKTIIILEEGEDPEGGRLGYEEYVKEFILHPNPNNGSFHVGIELSEETPITVSVWHAPTGLLIRQIQKSGDRLYQIYFDLRPLSSGTYILRLDYDKGKKYIRFVVN